MDARSISQSTFLLVFFWAIPYLFRPIDAKLNFYKYLKGNGAYILMSLVHLNVMKVFSMCNTNDISWGNRPPLDPKLI